MRKDIKKILVSVVIILCCVAAIQWAQFLFDLGQDDPMRIVSQRTKGPANAPIKIIEYVDFRCGPCGYGARWLNGFMKNHPGEIFLEVRYFPLHLSHGALTARFAECALKEQKFWEVYHMLFFEQRHWIRLANPEDFFLEVAKKQQMDVEALKTCWDDPKVYDEVMAIKHEGKKLGVSATPTYFVNEKMLVGLKNLAQELSRLLDIPLDLKISQ